MGSIIDDLLHAQPNGLMVLAGLLFLAIAIVGSVKTYFNPGKGGRIAAGGVGAVLLIAGLWMSNHNNTGGPSAAAPPPETPGTTTEALSKSTAVAGQTTTTACFVPHKWPMDVHKQMTVGDTCTSPDGEGGKAVLVNSVCTYNSGPKAGTNEQFKHLMWVGFNCQSSDHSSKGTVLPPAAQH